MTRLVIDRVDPAPAIRGARVTMSGSFPTDVDSIQVALETLEAFRRTAPSTDVRTGIVLQAEPRSVDDSWKRPSPVYIDAPGSSFSFVMPPHARLGRYVVTTTFYRRGRSASTMPFATTNGPVAVVSGEAVKIEAVQPRVNYPNQSLFSFTVIGEGFSPFLEDNALVLDGVDVLRPCADTTRDVAPPGTHCVQLRVRQQGRELTFLGLPFERYRGSQRLRVRVGDRASEPVAVVLSSVDEKLPLTIAGGVLLALAAIVTLLLAARPKIQGAPKRTLLEAIFVDEETCSYSLSKFQFVLWTGAAVFAYSYLTAARSLVQGVFTFAEIPDGLPGILAVTGSTTAVALGITASRGSKGAGASRPSVADFVCTGSVVAAERLQFLVWTVLGVFAFVVLTISISPGSIETLPAIPEKLLVLMGLSSAGYLGGKLARKRGPVIQQVEAVDGSLKINIKGSGLSKDATFLIDGKPITSRMFDSEKPNFVFEDDQSEFASEVKLVLSAPLPEWLETGDSNRSKEHSLTVRNPDGQLAVWPFTIVKQADKQASQSGVAASTASNFP